MSRAWRPYAHHILDAIEKIRLIQVRGDLLEDEILYDAALPVFVKIVVTFLRRHRCSLGFLDRLLLSCRIEPNDRLPRPVPGCA